MKPFRRVSYLSIMLCLALIVAFACNKQTDFGADLLGSDIIPLKFDDTLSLQVINSSADSVPTYFLSANGNDINTQLSGNIQDPLFGKVKSDAYLVFEPDRLLSNFNPDILTYDSIVLSLAVDPNIFYGDTLTPMNINIERVSEDMFTDSIIYSTRSLATSGSIGSITGLQFTPRTSTEVIDSSGENKDTSLVPFFIRTRLSDAFGEDLFNNREIYDSFPKFTDFFKGVKISVENESSIFAINTAGDRTLITIHYHDSVPRTINLLVKEGKRRFSHYEMDPAGSEASEYQNSLEKGDEYLTLQGLAGLRPKIIFPNLDQYKGRGIKLVQLEMTVALPDDIPENHDPNFREVDQMAVSGVNTAGALSFIEDFRILRTNNQLNLFGGTPRIDLVNGVKVKRYTINMTQHFIRMLSGDETKEIVLSVGGTRRANRVMLYGPGHSTYPLRLKIAYSDL